MTKLTWAVAVSALLVGCTRTNVAVLDPTLRMNRTCPDAVTIYTTAEKVPGEYKEVALLNSAGSTGFTSEAGMLKSMRKKAAEAGANGIILQDIKEPNAATKVMGAFLGTGSERKGKSVAIYVPADSLKTYRTCTTAQ